MPYKKAVKYVRFLNKKYGFDDNECYESSGQSFFIKDNLIIRNNFYTGCGCGCGAGAHDTNTVIGRCILNLK